MSLNTRSPCGQRVFLYFSCVFLCHARAFFTWLCQLEKWLFKNHHFSTWFRLGRSIFFRVTINEVYFTEDSVLSLQQWPRLKRFFHISITKRRTITFRLYLSHDRHAGETSFSTLSRRPNVKVNCQKFMSNSGLQLLFLHLFWRNKLHHVLLESYWNDQFWAHVPSLNSQTQFCDSFEKKVSFFPRKIWQF